MRSFIITITVAILFTACKSSDNGDYVVYSVKPDMENDSVADKLKNSLQGETINLNFNEKYVSIEISRSHRPLVLPETASNGTYHCYELQMKDHDTISFIRISKDTAVTLEVFKFPGLKDERELHKPRSSTYYSGTPGHVTCLLTKKGDN